jgi:lipopolysaccharide transport system permease protein
MNIGEFERVVTSEKSIKNVFSEIWRYRDLAYYLAWRDFKVRYKQTVIGVLWAFLRPLLTMIVFTIVFSRIAGLPSQGNAPYAVMVFAAMLPWYFFSSSFQEGSGALIANANLVSKVYFPRVLVPLSCLFVNLVDFMISLVILICLMAYFRFWPSANILYLPCFLLIAFIFSMAVILWTSALNVQYRDVKYVVPFAVQLGLYVSPVGFSSEVVANQWRVIYSLNPMVGVIDGFRWCILGENVDFYWPGLWLALSISLLLLLSGYWYFSKVDRKMADII